MRYFLEINVDNAAFESQMGLEVARIVRSATADLEDLDSVPTHGVPKQWSLRDVNGNRVGHHGFNKGHVDIG